MASNTVIVFGAGATKACGGPLTNEILPEAFQPHVRCAIEREGFTPLLDRFLIEVFHVPRHPADRSEGDYPSLPLLISLLETAIQRREVMSGWNVELLELVRRALQYVIFALLELKLRTLKANYYLKLFQAIHAAPPTVISLNYDIIADNAFAEQYGCLPDYACDIATERYRALPRAGLLLEIHGSLNWSYCPQCQRLELGVAASGKTYKVLDEIYHVNPLEERYSCHGFPCKSCAAPVEPILITPTKLKDYQNIHVKAVWARAEQELNTADRAIIVGYSLPDDDLEVTYLLKRGLEKLAARSPKSLTVVGRATADGVTAITKHPVGRRYRAIFGPDIDWRTDGFEGLIARP